jgi:hypothetical protein
MPELINVTVPSQTKVLTVKVPGMQGPAGRGLNLNGAVQTYANLPTNLSASDSGKAYLVNADGKLYVWDGTKFPANGSGVSFQGPAGPVSSLTMGSVITSDPGSGASAAITGNAPNQQLTLTIPRGATGLTGPANVLTIGSVVSGTNASATITGTSPNQSLNLVLPKGVQGDIGLTGPATTLAIGTITTGTPGSPAAAILTGTAPNQVLHLTIPQGPQGAPGSASSGTITSANITDATTVGVSLITSASASAARTTIGAAASSHTHSVSDLTATGTRDATTYLRGDGVWSVPPSSSGSSTVTASNIVDASTVGRSVLTATDAATARSVIGAGTSNLALGTTSTTALAGNYSPTKTTVGLANVDNTSDVNKPVSTAQQTAIDAKAFKTAVEGLVTHDGTTGGGTRPSGYFRVRWVGGTTRPTNMVTGDVWEHAG